MDSTPLWANTPGGGQACAFTVYGAWGYEAGERSERLVALWAQGGRARASTWVTFFRLLAGAPRLVVTDHDTTTIAGAQRAFPGVTIRLCRWHLRRNFTEKIAIPVVGTDLDHPLRTAGSVAFDTAPGWKAFKSIADRLELEPPKRKLLDQWIRSRDGLLSVELAVPGLPDHWGNGPVEQALRQVRDQIERRAFCYRNAARMNLLLELIRLRINRHDDVDAYAAAIRTHLQAARTLPRQLTIRDPRGNPSLR